MDIINLIFWSIGILFFVGHVWLDKAGGEKILAQHINDLQDYKTDKDADEIITGVWRFTGHQHLVHFSNDGDMRVAMYAYSDAQQDNPTITMQRSRGTFAIRDIVQQDDPCGEWVSYGFDGDTWRRVARIYMDVDGVPGAGDMPGRIDFEVTPTGGITPLLGMRLNHDLNLGLGGAEAWGDNATKTVSLATGVAPTTSPADLFQLYSADQVGGNACPHIRTENGAILKLYQCAKADYNNWVAFGDVVDALVAMGIFDAA